MSLDRTFILRDSQQLMAVSVVIAANWKAMAASEHPLAVHVYEHKDKRTLEANALMWVRLGEIAEQAWVGGRQYAADLWHEFCKEKFLPDEAGPTKRTRKGYRKYDYLPNGRRDLVGSTTLLTTFGMHEYMEQLTAYGAGELGVMFSATPREMAGM
jgi:hypothetical protein